MTRESKGIGKRSKQTITIQGICEHGIESPLTVQLPLTCELLEIPDCEPREWIVWFKGARHHYVSPVAPASQCHLQQEFILAATTALLKTDAGQNRAISYLRHAFEDERPHSSDAANEA